MTGRPRIDPPRDLTIPEEGSATARGVLSRALGRLVGDLMGLARSSPALRGIVAPLMRENPGALISALRTPAVGTLVRCAREGGPLAGPEGARIREELTALLSLELGRTGALPSPVRLDRPPERLISISGRFVVAIPPDCSAILIENGKLRLERIGAATEALDLGALEGTGPYYPIDGTITLALAENNPLAMTEAHPEKGGNAIDLGGHPVNTWTSALASALIVIGRYLPEIRAEMDLFIHQVIPVGWDAERHLSASYQEAIGTIYLSLHPSLMTMAEALIHEFSHTKLNALFELDAVLENAWSPLYASPVRPDPRPLHGVLLAVHAFLPVARLYELMIEAGDPEAESASFMERFAQIRRLNREGAEVVLANGRPTDMGAGLFDEIRRWDTYFSRWEI